MSGPEQVQGGGVWSCSCFHLLSAGVSLLALSFFGFRPIANRRGTLKKKQSRGRHVVSVGVGVGFSRFRFPFSVLLANMFRVSLGVGSFSSRRLYWLLVVFG